ncbi:hypothetical protein CDV31_001991 [Fusarium ambrosium]|uniref:Uncharacterized protein n=1 Tax=Fusarium ambrosium TaxID=131363 RepID=A0A428UXX2_9HYPO|nr:hypothetical protein CDV31_001991 [Fusarium ambrosium]
MKSSPLSNVGMAMLAYASIVSAQQFEHISYPFYTFNLTDTCFSMINTTITECSSLLNVYTTTPEGAFEPARKEHLDQICVPACREALVNFRPKVEEACNTTKDAVAFHYGDMIFAPTYQTDMLLVSYDIHCYKDRNTGRFCDELLEEWRTGRDTNFPIECEDCTLRQWMKQLQSPIRYHDEAASKFSKATSACSATGYEYVTPTTQYISQVTMYTETWLDDFTTPTPTPTP